MSKESSTSLVTWPEMLGMGQPVWSCVREPDLEAVCQLGRLACLCKLLDLGTDNKALHEEFPRLHTGVRLAACDQQSFETLQCSLSNCGIFHVFVGISFGKGG